MIRSTDLFRTPAGSLLRWLVQTTEKIQNKIINESQTNLRNPKDDRNQPYSVQKNFMEVPVVVLIAGRVVIQLRNVQVSFSI
jgi:hypothetical protein